MSANTVDADYYLNECRQVLDDANRMLEDVSSTDGNDRKRLLRDIGDKIRRAQTGIQAVECDIVGFDDEIAEQYEERVRELQAEINEADEKLKEATADAKMSEQARAQGVSKEDLMQKATNLQQGQIDSLGRAVGALTQAQETGENTMVELQRQQEQLGHAIDHMETIDQEIARAKVVMKQMFVRAAGDQCVRILAVLVVIAVVALIIVEAVMPNTIKETAEGWFNTATGSNTTAV